MTGTIVSTPFGNAQLADGAYVYNQPQTPYALPSISPSLSALIGTVTWGKKNVPIPISPTGVFDAIGGQVMLSGLVDAHSITDEAERYFGVQGSGPLLAIPISDGTDTAATGNINDSTGVATGTLTVAGTPAAGNTVVATFVNGSTTIVTPAYVATALDTVSTIATGLANLINSSPAVAGSSAFLGQATTSAGVITITALVAGTAGNAITVAGTATGGGVTISPSTATAMSGGAAAVAFMTFTGQCTGTRGNTGTFQLIPDTNSTTANPYYRLTTNIQYAQSEIWSSIPGFSTAGGGLVVATLIANAVSAVNNGTSQRAKSKYWVASAGTTTHGPSANTFSASGGTDGAASVGPSQFCGQNGVYGTRTGMYALTGCGVGQFAFAGYTVQETASLITTFTAAQNSFSLPYTETSGTSTTAAIANKQANNVTSVYTASCMAWLRYTDPLQNNGQYRLVSPLGEILGIISSMPPAQSAGNKPRTGLTNIIGTDELSPLDPTADILARQNAGILFITAQTPRGLLGLPHGQNSASTLLPGQDSINYTRMTNYLIVQLAALAAPFVDELQGTDANDETRNGLRIALRTFLSGLAGQQSPGQTKQINSYEVVVSNPTDSGSPANTDTTIGEGYLFWSALVEYMGTARVIFGTIQAGPNVQTQTVQNATLLAA